ARTSEKRRASAAAPSPCRATGARTLSRASCIQAPPEVRSGPGMDQRIPATPVQPGLRLAKARGRKQLHEIGQPVFVAVFRMDPLARRKAPLATRPAHALWTSRRQVHLDARVVRVEEGLVAPL